LEVSAGLSFCMRRTLPAMMCLMLGNEVCFGSFFLSLLGLRRR
jgi:hypothetical protein